MGHHVSGDTHCVIQEGGLCSGSHLITVTFCYFNFIDINIVLFWSVWTKPNPLLRPLLLVKVFDPPLPSKPLPIIASMFTIYGANSFGFCGC